MSVSKLLLLLLQLMLHLGQFPGLGSRSSKSIGHNSHRRHQNMHTAFVTKQRHSTTDHFFLGTIQFLLCRLLRHVLLRLQVNESFLQSLNLVVVVIEFLIQKKLNIRVSVRASTCQRVMRVWKNE